MDILCHPPVEIGDEADSIDSCPWCEAINETRLIGFDDTPDGVDRADTWSSENDNHFGTEYSYDCEMCEGSINIEIIHRVRGINPPTQEKLAHIAEAWARRAATAAAVRHALEPRIHARAEERDSD
jgi:hypothetical protein